ncbi:MAG TPA: UDP-N-acetylglucosamine 2-epimerase (non-hydrolyzing) [bacterium]|nr:UDP-N-acetylglucosamine 2-epimerase (non-hydrolyzing) [bacterium]
MIKIMSIFGTRPEAIKMAPVIKEIKKFPDEIINRVFVTAQHREMLDQVLEIFQITPDQDLNIMLSDQTPTQVAANILSKLELLFKQEKPDWVLVQGDTTTVAATALAAFYSGVKVGHVEAGLRTNDKQQPFPEEINRRVASVITDLHFAPTETSRQNLLKENISADNIVITGNTVIDALHWVLERPIGIEKLILPPNEPGVILVTAHRRENFGKPLENICQALLEIVTSFNGKVKIVYPVHLNPNVQNVVYRLLANNSNIILTPPLDYLSLAHLMKAATLVLTDSGGIQEEAPSLGKPVLVLREITERPEAVAAGTVKIVGANFKKIVDSVTTLLTDQSEYAKMAHAVNPYGDGLAAERIINTLLGKPVEPFNPIK